MKRRVVLTGACGYVAQRMIDALRERFDLVGLDVSDRTPEGEKVAGVHVVDLTDPDRDRYRHHFRGADAVIHCAFVRRDGGGSWRETSDARFRTECTNVALAYNVYRTALENGVRRVVVASSNHAADYYERLWAADRLDMVTPEMPPLSDNFYGWSKAASELLGFVFATGAVDGRKLEIVQWRLGSPREDDLEKVVPGDVKSMRRALGAYLSARDQIQQAVLAVETEQITDLHGVPFLIVYGISGNSHRFWSLESARLWLDYRPADDSQLRFVDRIVEIARAPGKERRGPEASA